MANARVFVAETGVEGKDARDIRDEKDIRSPLETVGNGSRYALIFKHRTKARCQ